MITSGTGRPFFQELRSDSTQCGLFPSEQSGKSSLARAARVHPFACIVSTRCARAPLPFPQSGRPVEWVAGARAPPARGPFWVAVRRRAARDSACGCNKGTKPVGRTKRVATNSAQKAYKFLPQISITNTCTRCRARSAEPEPLLLLFINETKRRARAESCWRPRGGEHFFSLAASRWVEMRFFASIYATRRA